MEQIISRLFSVTNLEYLSIHHTNFNIIFARYGGSRMNMNERTLLLFYITCIPSIW